LSQLAQRIDAGLAVVAPLRQTIQQQVADLQLVAATLEPQNGPLPQRRAQFAMLQEQFGESELPFQQHLSKTMANWQAGLFVGGRAADLPWDNLDLERWFRLPKGHERRIHGRQHAGMRLVREGPTLLLDVRFLNPPPVSGQVYPDFTECLWSDSVHGCSARQEA
jgi:hypothetical protein